jgi:hypothetical protein
VAHEFGLEKGYWTGDPATCKNAKCSCSIHGGETAFFDDAGGSYCERCGIIVRYERKKAAQRKARGQPTRPIMGLKE